MMCYQGDKSSFGGLQHFSSTPIKRVTETDPLTSLAQLEG